MQLKFYSNEGIVTLEHDDLELDSFNFKPNESKTMICWLKVPEGAYHKSKLYIITIKITYKSDDYFDEFQFSRYDYINNELVGGCTSDDNTIDIEKYGHKLIKYIMVENDDIFILSEMIDRND